MSEIKLKYKIWLEREGFNILGKGGAQLLSLIEKYGDLGKAAKEMKCSYKHAWNIIQKIKLRYKSPVITYKGGKGGGGGIELSKEGKKLLQLYRRFDEFIQDFLKNPELWESYGLNIDLKNIVKGKIVKIEKDDNVCKLKIELGSNNIITSIITTESVEELELKNNKEIMALIKATEIQIGVE